MVQKEIRKIKYLIEDEADLQSGLLETKSRTKDLVLARMVFSNFLMAEVGLKEGQMCYYLKRDRTSFYYYFKKHFEYINDSRIYPEYNDLYTRVYNRYNSLEDKLFNNEDRISKMLYLSEIENNITQLVREKNELHRKLLENGLFADAELLKVFIWCLLKANSSKIDKNVYNAKLKTGEFITGRMSASEELFMKPSTVHDRLKRLQRMSYIKIKSTTKYTIISVVNFTKYQLGDNSIPKTPLQERLNKFVDEVVRFSNVYDKSILEDFISYWTETNKSQTKMRFELQQTWNTKLRILNWFKRSEPKKENKVQKSINTWQEARNMINNG